MKKFIHKIYAYSFFNQLGFVYPFIAIIFQDYGLSATQIAIVIASMYVTQFVTEIPSGALADKFNRKWVLISSQICKIIGFGIWIFIPNFWGFLIGFSMLGLRQSLNSGCYEAFIYDELKDAKKDNLYTKILGRQGAFSTIASGTAAITAAYMITNGYDFVLWASIASSLVAVLVMLVIETVPKVDDIEEHVADYITTLKEGVKYSINHKTVFKLLLFSSFTLFINVGYLDYFEIFLKEIVLNLSLVAIICGLFEFVFAIGNWCAEYFNKIKTKNLVFIYVIAAIVDIVTFTIYKFPISIVLVFTNGLIISAVYVNFNHKTNDYIPKNIRATTLSMGGFVTGFGSMIVLLIFGRVVDIAGSYQIGFLTFAYMYAIGSILFYFWIRSDKLLDKKEKMEEHPVYLESEKEHFRDNI
ncbi:MFS transporter [bacterium]|jgi:MFS family permease|nr:MFS transporter [bacterium]MBT4551449.1 MFS transporter [bacterium]